MAILYLPFLQPRISWWTENEIAADVDWLGVCFSDTRITILWLFFDVSFFTSHLILDQERTGQGQSMIWSCLGSVLWCHWLGSRNSIQSIKNLLNPIILLRNHAQPHEPHKRCSKQNSVHIRWQQHNGLQSKLLLQIFVHLYTDWMLCVKLNPQC